MEVEKSILEKKKLILRLILSTSVIITKKKSNT